MNHFLKKMFSEKWIVQPLLALLILFGGVGTVFAINSVSEGYRLTSTVQTVNAHTICRTAKTTSGSNVFAPTKTSAEWSAFVANKPANVTLGSCCAGASYGGYCWYLGTVGQSCDTTCASHGGVDMAGTRDYTGTGNPEYYGAYACRNVLQALGTPSYTNCSYKGTFGTGTLNATMTGSNNMIAFGPQGGGSMAVYQSGNNNLAVWKGKYGSSANFSQVGSDGVALGNSGYTDWTWTGTIGTWGCSLYTAPNGCHMPVSAIANPTRSDAVVQANGTWKRACACNN